LAVPVPKNLCILKSGLLFVASGFRNHHVYWFNKLEDEEGVKFGR